VAMVVWLLCKLLFHDQECGAAKYFERIVEFCKPRADRPSSKLT